MGRVCTICQLPPKTRKQLESDYINGVNINQLAKTYSLSWESVSHHVQTHLPNKMVEGARELLQIDTNHLAEQIDQIYSWAKVIFKRNYDKGYDKTALKALSEQRNTLQLLAQISVAFHKTRVAELEHEKERQLTGSNIQLEKLTKKEQELYFKLTQKLLGDDDTTIDYGYTDVVDDDVVIRKRAVQQSSKDQPNNEPNNRHDSEPDNRGTFEAVDQNTSEIPQPRLIRKRKPKQEEEPMTFQPLRKNAPINDPKVNLKRRMMSRLIESSDDEQYPNTPGSPLF